MSEAKTQAAKFAADEREKAIEAWEKRIDTITTALHDCLRNEYREAVAEGKALMRTAPATADEGYAALLQAAKKVHGVLAAGIRNHPRPTSDQANWQKVLRDILHDAIEGCRPSMSGCEIDAAVDFVRESVAGTSFEMKPATADCEQRVEAVLDEINEWGHMPPGEDAKDRYTKIEEELRALMQSRPATAEGELVARIRKLPTYDSKGVRNVLKCDSGARFVVSEVLNTTIDLAKCEPRPAAVPIKVVEALQVAEAALRQKPTARGVVGDALKAIEVGDLADFDLANWDDHRQTIAKVLGCEPLFGKIEEKCKELLARPAAAVSDLRAMVQVFIDGSPDNYAGGVPDECMQALRMAVAKDRSRPAAAELEKISGLFDHGRYPRGWSVARMVEDAVAFGDALHEIFGTDKHGEGCPLDIVRNLVHESKKPAAVQVPEEFLEWARKMTDEPIGARYFAVAKWILSLADGASEPAEPTDYPECSGDPASCPENEGYGCCNAKPAEPAEPSEVKATMLDLDHLEQAKPSRMYTSLVSDLRKGKDCNLEVVETLLAAEKVEADLKRQLEEAVAESTMHKRQLQEAKAEAGDLRKWRSTVAASLQIEGGTLYSDVPKHIKALRERSENAEASGNAKLEQLREWAPTGIAWGQGGEAAKLLGELDRLLAAPDEGDGEQPQAGDDRPLRTYVGVHANMPRNVTENALYELCHSELARRGGK